MNTAKTRLEELQMIQCSLLPGESLTFVENADFWNLLLAQNTNFDLESRENPSAATFTIKVVQGPVVLQVTMPMGPGEELVSVKGDSLSRAEQERWVRIIEERRRGLGDIDFALYNLLSLDLIPLLHEALERQSAEKPPSPKPENVSDERLYHVLFTSHHLVSSKKRRSLQQWSASLNVSGFAKVGYPGVIYAQGLRESIEEFVSNVKSMQWLALRVRFVECVPEGGDGSLSGWREFSRVGEVVEEMRRIGREDSVIEMGIGSAGSG